MEGEPHIQCQRERKYLSILFEKKSQTDQPMTFQTHAMEVSHQRPCSRFYAAHAIVF